MKASELYSEDPTLKVLVYGDSGTGKTTWGARSPRPLVLMTERQGLPSIATVNPDADVEAVKDWTHARRMLDHIKTGAVVETADGQPAFQIEGKAGPVVFQTLVLDSLTDLHDRLATHHGVHSDTTRDPRKAWGKVQRDLRVFMHDVRSLPVNVVALALSHQVGGDDGSERRVLPSLYGKAAESIGQYFNAVGYSHKRKTGHTIGFSLPSTWVTKSPPTMELFPSLIHQSMDDPGMTTLGSILSYLNPDTPVAMAEGDSRSVVESQT